MRKRSTSLSPTSGSSIKDPDESRVSSAFAARGMPVWEHDAGYSTPGNGGDMRQGFALATVLVALAVPLCACSSSGGNDPGTLQRMAAADQEMSNAYNNFVQLEIEPGSGIEQALSETEPAFDTLKAKYHEWDLVSEDLTFPEEAGDGLPSQSQISGFRVAMMAFLNTNEAAVAQLKICAQDYDPASCVQENTGPGKTFDVQAAQQAAQDVASTREPLRNPPQ